MTTIYLVTEGDYSKYHICAAFSTKVLAQDYTDKFDGDNIEEYELDPSTPTFQDGMNVYMVFMKKNGDSDSAEYFETLNGIVPESHVKFNDSYYKDGILINYVLARDKMHAVKITNEKRAQLIASGEWK
jgi:hypothetical protein